MPEKAVRSNAQTQSNVLQACNRNMKKEITRCDYNNSCYETAKDGYYIEYDWNVLNNLEAEFEVGYKIEGVEHTLNVCEGCKADIESNCEDYDDSEFHYETRLRPQTEGYKGRRSARNYHIQNTAWTEKERMTWMNKWHKNNKKHPGHRCTEACWHSSEAKN